MFIDFLILIFFISVFILFRIDMSLNPTTLRTRSSQDELSTRSITNIPRFLYNCVLDADHKALEEYLLSNPGHQSDLDRCLLRGLRLVLRRDKTLSHVAQSLTILLQSGAKWNGKTLSEITPYHIICASPGDHHELLDLMIKLFPRTIIDIHDGKERTALLYAALKANIKCFECLIANGANVNIGGGYRYSFVLPVWAAVAHLGNIEMLRCMFNNGLDKDSTVMNGCSVLWWVVHGGRIEAVRHLLALGVAIPSVAPDVHEIPSEQWEENRLITEGTKLEHSDPCEIAIIDNNLEIVKLLEERGSRSCQSFSALKLAVLHDSVDIVSYLLNKYTYPLNMEYIINCSIVDTLFKEPIFECRTQITKLLLDHGADPAKPLCAAINATDILTSIEYGHSEVLAQYIRSGVNINFRSHIRFGVVLPFEFSVIRGYYNLATMLLISGCSCGVFSLDDHHEFKDGIGPDEEKLMEEWNVQENNVTPLKQRCRSVILNHLSPGADLKIEKLPLPDCLIKFLGIPELDDLIDTNHREICGDIDTESDTDIEWSLRGRQIF